MAGYIRIYNRSKQMVPLTISPPRGDFYKDSQNIYLMPGKNAQLPKSYINEEQVRNLQKNRYLQIIHEDAE